MHRLGSLWTAFSGMPSSIRWTVFFCLGIQVPSFQIFAEIIGNLLGGENLRDIPDLREYLLVLGISVVALFLAYGFYRARAWARPAAIAAGTALSLISDYNSWPFVVFYFLFFVVWPVHWLYFDPEVKDYFSRHKAGSPQKTQPVQA